MGFDYVAGVVDCNQIQDVDQKMSCDGFAKFFQFEMALYKHYGVGNTTCELKHQIMFGIRLRCGVAAC